MAKGYFFIFLFVAFPGLLISQHDAEKFLTERGEVYFRFAIEENTDLSEVSSCISIDRLSGDTVYAYANREEWNHFQKFNFVTEVLVPPSLQYKPRMAGALKSMKDWASYPDYETYLKMMQDFTIQFPHICRSDTIGNTVNGRWILSLVISDSIQFRQNEPRVFYSSSIHGDELTGFVLMLRLADSLLNGYGKSPLITSLVDNLEITINPLANPDGTYYSGNSTVSGAIRYNANGKDLNRNFPDPRAGEYPGGTRQMETSEMMRYMQKNRFVLSANFHGGAEVANYPWDTWSKTSSGIAHPDDAWFAAISKEYADTAQRYGPSQYFKSVTSSGYVNGGDWYVITGGRQDYITYFQAGREVTLEISDVKLPPASSLPMFWEANKRSLLNYLQRACDGIEGIVQDETGNPVYAKIEMDGHDTEQSKSFVFSDSLTGYFCRLILPGTYTLKATDPENPTKIFTGTTVSHFQNQYQSIEFLPFPEYTFSDSFAFPMANCSSGLPLSFTSSQPEVADWINGKIYFKKAGEAILTAHQFGNGRFLPATSISKVITISKSNQTINFPIPVETKAGMVNLKLEAVSTSGLPVSYSSSDESIAGITGDFLQIVDTGTVVITAHQQGNENFFPAAEKSIELQITEFVGIREGERSEIVVFPNPNNGIFCLILPEFRKGSHYLIRISNSLGEVVFEQKSSQRINTLGPLHLPQGVYILSIFDSERKLYSTKVIFH